MKNNMVKKELTQQASLLSFKHQWSFIMFHPKKKVYFISLVPHIYKDCNIHSTYNNGFLKTI
jgi:hypothetical protein